MTSHALSIAIAVVGDRSDKVWKSENWPRKHRTNMNIRQHLRTTIIFTALMAAALIFLNVEQYLRGLTPAVGWPHAILASVIVVLFSALICLGLLMYVAWIKRLKKSN